MNFDNLGQLGQMLMQAGQQQQPQQPAPMPMGMPQAPGGGTAMLQLIMQLAPNARSEDELAQMLAQYGEPPAAVQPQMPMAPPKPQTQTQLPVGMALAQPGTVPQIHQTRGEAATNPSLGFALG